MNRESPRRGARYGDGERRPASDRALDAHPTTVHLDERLHHRETESQSLPLVLEPARGVLGGVEGGEERLEQARPARLVDSPPRVAHADLGAAVSRESSRQRNASGVRSELDRVQQEVIETVPDLLRL